MLGNVAPVREVILAAMKLGAVIIPTSTLLQPADLADRLARGARTRSSAGASGRCSPATRRMSPVDPGSLMGITD